MRTTAVIVAAGKGVRMGKTIGKQFLPLGGRPILTHTLSVFDKSEMIDQIILVISSGDKDYCQTEILAKMNFGTPLSLAIGGRTRQESVCSGLAYVRGKESIVVIHDGVRPFVHPRHIVATVEKARETGACILGLPVTDTLKHLDGDHCILSTLERTTVWIAQTPQVFRFSTIWQAHQAARKAGYIGTDDAQLVERLGLPVTVVPGSRSNIKITTPEDLKLAEAVLGFT